MTGSATAMDTLKGQILIAMPQMADERFADSVIYLIEHNDQGAMGLIINRTHEDMRFGDVLEDLSLGDPDDMIRLNSEIAQREVVEGGPVERARGFVLHSHDYFSQGSSVKVDDSVCLTANLEVLRAIAFSEQGPERSLFALGYCGWGEGQLETELASNSWLTADCQDDLVFSVPFPERYDAALALLGINRAILSAEAGHA